VVTVHRDAVIAVCVKDLLMNDGVEAARAGRARGRLGGAELPVRELNVPYR
jgi:hypothetical protein